MAAVKRQIGFKWSRGWRRGIVG